jgi:hypothetical protein
VPYVARRRKAIAGNRLDRRHADRGRLPVHLASGTGGQTCTPECICDTSGDGSIAASDALLVLEEGGRPEASSWRVTAAATTIPRHHRTTSTTLGPSNGDGEPFEGDAAPGAQVSALADVIPDRTAASSIRSRGHRPAARARPSNAGWAGRDPVPGRQRSEKSCSRI